MTATKTDPLRRLVELARDVDREFDSIRQRQGEWMQCRSGCNDCCRARLSVTRVEEALLRRGLEQMPDATRREMALAANDDERQMCPALDPQGRCRVYASRPLICRSFGVPLRRTREVRLVNPPVIDACDLNFVGRSLEVLPAEDVFDQTGLEATVSEIDADYCERNALPPGERVPIARILSRR